jgi:hypothetical protein
LFKIRHCMNIEAWCVTALFELPIDPALLAARRGIALIWQP